MTENTDANSTADDDFLLLYDVRALVAQRTHSLPEAERLTIEFAQRGHFTKWDYRGDRYIPPEQWGRCYPKLGLSCPVDFDNSTVSYVYEGPPSETVNLVWEDVWEEVEKFARELAQEKREKKLRRRRHPQARSSPVRRRSAAPSPSFLPPSFFQMALVGLARDEVFLMLRKARLLGSSEQLPVLESSASPETEAQLQTPASVRELSAKKWITREAQRLKRLGKIPVGKGAKTKFAKLLEANMKEAARTDTSISISPVSYKHILNQLSAWGLWPIDVIT